MAQPATAETPETADPKATPGGDSIGEQLEARLARLPAVPSDAIDMKNVGTFIFTPVAEKVMAKDVRRPRRAA